MQAGMDIVIPTCGRSGGQTTLQQLEGAGLKATLVVQAQEAHEYAKYRSSTTSIRVLPPSINTVAPTRQWILENVGVHDKVVMVDDDLVFYMRRDDDRTKLRDIYPRELNTAFWEMNHALGLFAHAGFAAREGANRNTDSLVYNTRIMRVLGYRRDVLQRYNIRFDALPLMEDFHVAISLLKRGEMNVVLNNYAHNQSGSNKAGGCSTFRTPELHAASAKALALLHPAFVEVVEKTTKGAWGGGTRTDVRISWKKAYTNGNQ